MKSLVLSPFNIWLSAAIELIPRDELMALIRQFNSEAEYPTVKLLNTLITEYRAVTSGVFRVIGEGEERYE